LVEATAPNGTQTAVVKRYRQVKTMLMNNNNNNKQTNKNFKQFDDLHAVLLRSYPAKSLPSLPPKKMVGNMNVVFVRTRCLGLQKYLNTAAQLENIDT
jgi:hypothetical protein